MLASIYETDVKLVLHVTADFYLKNRELVSIQFNNLRSYKCNFQIDRSYIVFENVGIPNNFDKIKTAFLNKEIKKCVLSAKGIRKNCLTQEEEFYPELDGWECRLSSFYYNINSELESTVYDFCFDNDLSQ